MEGEKSSGDSDLRLPRWGAAMQSPRFSSNDSRTAIKKTGLITSLVPSPRTLTGMWGKSKKAEGELAQSFFLSCVKPETYGKHETSLTARNRRRNRVPAPARSDRVPSARVQVQRRRRLRQGRRLEDEEPWPGSQCCAWGQVYFILLPDPSGHLFSFFFDWTCLAVWFMWFSWGYKHSLLTSFPNVSSLEATETPLPWEMCGSPLPPPW